MLDAVKNVAFGSPTESPPCGKADGHAFARVAVARGVDAFAAVNRVSAIAAHERVVAAEPTESVVGGVAYQEVAVKRSLEILDTVEVVAFGRPTETLPCGEVHAHAFARVEVPRSLDVAPTVT